MSERHRRNPNTVCMVCAKEIYRRPSEIEINNGRVFCSPICYGIGCRKEKPCAICKKPILAGLNKKTCSRSCANIQRTGIRYHLGSPRSKVKSQQALKIKLLKARGKKCEKCDYSKYEILQVHHKDRDRNNNDPTNLALICPNCHYEEHFLEKSWMKKIVEKELKKDILS